MNISEFKYLLCDNSRKINDGMNAALNAWGAKYGLSALQLRILMEIHQKGALTVGCLASNVAIAGTNISTMCKKLESLGFLRRTREQSDERVVRIELTESGWQAIEEIEGFFAEKIQKAMSSDMKQSLEAIIYAMEKLNKMLELFNEQEMK